ncbi:MAG: S-layer homology domain-containing protein [Candidatus Absconditabacterales bacterium]
MNINPNKYKIIISKLSFLSILILCVFIKLSYSDKIFAYSENIYPTISNNSNNITLNQNTDNIKDDLSQLGKQLGNKLLKAGTQLFEFIKAEINSGSLNSESEILNTFSSSNKIIDLNESEIQNNQTGSDDFFVDIRFNPNKYYINTLAGLGIIRGNNSFKFYPNNYILLGDFIKMVVETYRFSVGYDLKTVIGLTTKQYFSGINFIGFEKYINTAYELGFLNNILITGNLHKPITTTQLNILLNNINFQFPGVVKQGQLITSDGYIKRDDATRYVFQVFDLYSKLNLNQNLSQDYFIDIFGHPNNIAINTLASLGIINIKVNKFYPDNYVHHYDFVIMLVNSILTKNNQLLNIQNLSGFQSDFVDLVPDSNYIPFVKYAEKNHLLDYLIITKRGEKYFNPDYFITKHEAYFIISKITNTQILYNINDADQENITRGQLASLLQNSFDFQQKKTSKADSTKISDLQKKISLLSSLKELITQL